MKRLILIILCSLGLSAQSLTQTFIPNGDMENWVSDSFFNLTSEKPEDWFTFNIPFLHFVNVPYGVSRTTDAHSGNFALRLENTHNLIGHVAGIGNIIETGMDSMELIPGKSFPCLPIPTKISGYFKCNLTNPGDTSFIRVHLYQGDDPAANLVAFTHVDFVHPLVQNEYTYFEKELAMISNNPVENIYIEVDMSRIPDEEPIVIGDFLQLDSLAIDCLVGTKDPRKSEYNVQVYPNPASDNVKIEVETPLVGKSQIILFDTIGKRLNSQALTSNVNTISLTNMPDIIFYQIVNENQAIVGSGQILNVK